MNNISKETNIMVREFMYDVKRNAELIVELNKIEDLEGTRKNRFNPGLKLYVKDDSIELLDKNYNIVTEYTPSIVGNSYILRTMKERYFDGFVLTDNRLYFKGLEVQMNKAEFKDSEFTIHPSKSKTTGFILRTSLEGSTIEVDFLNECNVLHKNRPVLSIDVRKVTELMCIPSLSNEKIYRTINKIKRDLVRSILDEYFDDGTIEFKQHHLFEKVIDEIKWSSLADYNSNKEFEEASIEHIASKTLAIVSKEHMCSKVSNDCILLHTRVKDNLLETVDIEWDLVDYENNPIELSKFLYFTFLEKINN